MKSIAEIQNEIKDIGLRVSELNMDLEELKPRDTINTQTDFAKINRLAQQHPIKDHILEQADHYKKKLYLTVLSTIAQTNTDYREGKLVFLQRIALGMKYEGSLESLVKDGMDINDKILDEFVKCMTDNDSKQLFIFESLIISNLGGEIDDIAKKYISELSGYLNIKKDEATFLIKLSVCVLEQSMSKYQHLVNIVPEMVDITIFFNLYMKNFICGVVCDTKWLYFVYGIDADVEMISSISEKWDHGFDNWGIKPSQKELENKKNLEGKKIIFEKVRFNLEKNDQNDQSITFYKCNSATFKNCDFKGTKIPIRFKTVDYINIIDCKFSGFEWLICECREKCKSVMVKKCTFERGGLISWNYNDRDFAIDKMGKIPDFY